MPSGSTRELLADEVGVGERLLAGSVLVVAEQVVASESVGDADQHHAGEQGDEREEQRDACSQAERSGPGHRCSVAGRVAHFTRTVHPLPVECQGEEGIPPGQREQSS